MGIKKIFLLVVLFVLVSHGATCPMQPDKAYAESASGKPEWASQTVQALGYGVMNPARFPRRGQAKLMAKRAAILDAKRKLLEKVLDLKLAPDSTIRDVVPEDDALNASTSGLISKAGVGRTEFYNGTYTIKVKLHLKNVYKYLKKKDLLQFVHTF